MIVVPIAVGFLPVLALLGTLLAIDSYKLVRPRAVAGSIAAGAAAAAACWAFTALAGSRLGLEDAAYSRWIAPVVEETAKALVLVALFRSQRIGFLVDAAIHGLAIGTGFAVVENAHYWQALPGAGPGVWIVRGFGTALMHGGATAIVAVAARTLGEGARERGAPAAGSESASRSGWESPHGESQPNEGAAAPARMQADGKAVSAGPPGAGSSPGRGAGALQAAALLPGLVLAMAVHSAFNHFFLSPIVSTVLVVLVLPPLFLFIFQRGEKALSRWLELGFDADTELLDLIGRGRLSESPIGRYLQEIRDRFEPEVVVDLVCYLRLHVELAVRAKGILMMREAGFATEVDEETREKLVELAALERSIGTTGRLALAPFLRAGGREVWQLQILGK